MRITLIPLLLVAITAASPARAAESYASCSGFIDSLPATISTQGVWCLRADLSTPLDSGNAILVDTNNVTIDCNDFKIGGLAAGDATYTHGIRSSRLNTTVRNCNIRGFYSGVRLLLGAGHKVENNRFDANTVVSIAVAGDGSVVRGNEVIDTGGSTVFSSSFGIEASGNVTVVDNIVANVAGTQIAYGIFSYQGNAGVVRDNRIHGMVSISGGSSYGIYTMGAGRVIVRDNEVQGTGVANSLGIRCHGIQATAQGNVISGVETPLQNCTSVNNTVNAN